MKLFLMAANIAFGISTSVKRTTSIANANRQQSSEDLCCSVGEWSWVLNSQAEVLAPCSLYRLFVNFGDTWTKQKGHIWSPPTSTEAEHAIKKAAHTLFFCTLSISELGKNRSWSVENKGSLKAVAVSEWRRGQERRQKRPWLAKRENPGDETFTEMNARGCPGTLASVF